MIITAAWNSVVGTVSKQNATFSHQAAKFNDFKPNGVFGRDNGEQVDLDVEKKGNRNGK